MIFIVIAPQPRALQLAGVPHVYFPPYTRSESLEIVSSSPLPIIDPPLSDEDSSSTPIHESAISEDDSIWLWTRFCGAVWDSLGQAAARDLVSFQAVCSRLWKPFVHPVIQRDYGPREFSKLMVKNRALFQSEDPLKEPLLCLQPATSTASKPGRRKKPPRSSCYPGSLDLFRKNPADTSSISAILPHFPRHTAHLLLAAYLASHTHPRTDTVLYSKSSQHVSRRRRRQQGQTLPSNSATPARRRKISRHLLGPQPFPLERLFAIFHATSPSPVVDGGELMAQVATLAGLSLLLRASSAAADEGGGGGGGGGGGKWKVGFGWEFVAGVARGVGFDLDVYLGE